MPCGSKSWIAKVIIDPPSIQPLHIGTVKHYNGLKIGFCIVFFWSVARRFEKEIKEVLETYSQEKDKMEALLTGRRVQLAEELSNQLHALIPHIRS